MCPRQLLPLHTDEVQYATHALAFGARYGVRTTSSPSDANTASKAGGNFASRSWMRKRGDAPASCIVQARLRACCVTQAAVGWAVQPARCTRRVPTSKEEEDVQRLHEQRLDGEEVAGQHGIAVPGE